MAQGKNEVLVYCYYIRYLDDAPRSYLAACCNKFNIVDKRVLQYSLFFIMIPNKYKWRHFIAFAISIFLILCFLFLICDKYVGPAERIY